MFGLFDIVINIIEAATYAFLACNYIELKRVKRKAIFISIFSFLLAAEITISNNIMLYDGVYSVLYFSSMAIIMILFNDRENPISIENILIFAINLCGFVSVGNEITFLIAYVFCSMKPLEFVTQYMPIVFICRTIIIVIIESLIIKATKQYKRMHSGYDSLFITVFLIMQFIIVLNEEVLFTDTARIMQPIVTNIFVFVVVFLLYVIFYRTAYNHYISAQNDYLSAQLCNIKMNAELFEKKEKEIRTMKHDLVNQLTVMNGYLQVGEIDRCEEIIKKNIGELNKLPIWINSGYTAVDAILSVKLSIAKSKGINAKSMVQIAALSKEKEFDVAVILGNLIDNAIENINKDDPEIVVKITDDQDNTVINVRNKTEKKEITLETNKLDEKNHGLGLKSVHTLAEKYKGNVFIDLDNGVFSVIVILRL